MCVTRYKLIVEYLGAGFCGWQKQPGLLSVQQVVEEAVFNFTNQKVKIFAAGRTDAGVNAYGQVVHFDLVKKYKPKRLMGSINHFVRPHAVGIVHVEIVDICFHARFGAKARHYVYKIINRNSVNIICNGFRYLVRDDLDIVAMKVASKYLLGQHDFSSFRSSICQARSSVKTLDKIKIIQYGENIDIYISALSFLHHMVRKIVGSLLMVGKGNWPSIMIQKILKAADRNVAGPMVPPNGLYLLKVDY
jgi:tRNA pseudouridine38-40 synthase